MKKTVIAALMVTALGLVVLAQDATQPLGGNRVVLRVGSKETTRAEFDRLLFQYKAREFVEELIDVLLVQQAAEKAGLEVTDEEVSERQDELLMQELAQYDNDYDKLEAQLKRFGYTVEEQKNPFDEVSMGFWR